MRTVALSGVASLNRVVLYVFCLAALALPAAAETVTFSINYIDAAGTGFNAAGVAGAERRTAMNYAMSQYEGLFVSQYAGEEVRINARFGPTSFLGFAGPERFFNGPFPLPNTMYGTAIADHTFGTDIQNDFGFGPFNGPHISIEFGSVYIDGAGSEFYFGTDGAVGGGEFDFATVAIHEVMHGLGLVSLATEDGPFFDFGFPGLNQPHIYDHFVYDPVTGKTLAQMTNAERAVAITSGDLVWNGANAVAANGGVMPSIYSPSPYAPGSSISHWDENTYPNELMTPFLGFGESIHSLSPITIGALRDIGWHATPEPGTLTLVGVVYGLGLVRRRRRRRRAAAASN